MGGRKGRWTELLMEEMIVMWKDWWMDGRKVTKKEGREDWWKKDEKEGRKVRSMKARMDGMKMGNYPGTDLGLSQSMQVHIMHTSLVFIWWLYKGAPFHMTSDPHFLPCWGEICERSYNTAATFYTMNTAKQTTPAHPVRASLTLQYFWAHESIADLQLNWIFL